MNRTDFDRVISAALRVGVSLSTVLIAVGTVVSFVHRAATFDRRVPVATLEAIGRGMNTPRAILAGIENSRGQAIVATGLVVLVLTPIARVALSIGLFARQRDWMYVAITSAVLGLLALSTWLGGVS